MTEDPLPSEVLALVARALPSMIHIELLLLLRRTAPLGWSVTRGALELRTSPELVAATLDDLVAARLAEAVRGTDPVDYRFDPSDGSVVAAVSLLQESYDRRPVTLIKALYTRPATSVRAFADAFRLRPEGR